MASATRERASAVCLAEGRVLLVRMRDPVTRVTLLFPPGGGIEPGETAAEAARRETLEETGLRVRVDRSTCETVRYPYSWAGVEYDVTTHYFAAAVDEPLPEALPVVVDADYNLGAVWLPVNEALREMAPIIADGVATVLRRALLVKSAHR